VGTGASIAEDRERAAGLYEDAIQRFDAGDDNGAVIQAKNVLQIDPMNLPDRILLSCAYLRNGDGEWQKKNYRSRADTALVEVPLAEPHFMQRNFEELLRKFPRGGRDPATEGTILLIRGNTLLE